MKCFYVALSCLMLACNAKQKNNPSATSESAKSVDAAHLITMDGIGDIKEGISQTDLEAILKRKIPLTNPSDSLSGSWMDYATVPYQNDSLYFTFVRTYTTVTDSFYMRVLAIESTNPLHRTKGNIGVGSTKKEIIEAYPDKRIYMEPEYENDSLFTTSKVFYRVYVRDDREGPQIACYLKNGVVFKMEVSSYHDDEE